MWPSGLQAVGATSATGEVLWSAHDGWWQRPPALSLGSWVLANRHMLIAFAGWVHAHTDAECRQYPPEGTITLGWLMLEAASCRPAWGARGAGVGSRGESVPPPVVLAAGRDGRWPARVPLGWTLPEQTTSTIRGTLAARQGTPEARSRNAAARSTPAPLPKPRVSRVCGWLSPRLLLLRQASSKPVPGPREGGPRRRPIPVLDGQVRRQWSTASHHQEKVPSRMRPNSRHVQTQTLTVPTGRLAAEVSGQLPRNPGRGHRLGHVSFPGD